MLFKCDGTVLFPQHSSRPNALKTRQSWKRVAQPLTRLLCGSSDECCSGKLVKTRLRLRIKLFLMIFSTFLSWSAARNMILIDTNSGLDSSFGPVYVVYSGSFTAQHETLRLQLRSLGITGAEFKQFPRMQDGHMGCWKAHKTLALETLNRGENSMVVFEDDISFSSFYFSESTRVHRVLNGVRSLNWELFFFAHNPTHIQSWRTISSLDLVKVRSWSTVGYIARGALLERIAHSSYNMLPLGTVDGLLHASTRTWSFYPMLAVHPDKFSLILNRTRRLNWRKGEKYLRSRAANCSSQTATFKDFNKFSKDGLDYTVCSPRISRVPDF